MKAKLYVRYWSGDATETELDLKEKFEDEENVSLILPPLDWPEIKELIVKVTEYDEQ